jgi:hypothetical protein
MNSGNIKQEILLLATGVLTEDELRAVLDVIEEYKQARGKGIRAFYELDRTFSISRKDPMLAQQEGGFVDILNITPLEESWDSLQHALVYCRYFVNNTDLTHTSRDFVRRSCDYVENCTKYLLSSLDPNAPLKHPLGHIINALKRTQYNLPAELLKKLEDFNKIIYTVAKHEYNLPPGKHLYTPDEAFLIYFTAKKLGSAVRELVRLPQGFSPARHNPS